MSKINDLIKKYCPNGVEFKKLGEVTEVRSGWGFPTIYQGQKSGTYPFYKVSDMNLSGNEFVMTVANNYVNGEIARKLSTNPAPEGTVIFPKLGQRLLRIRSGN